jgi:hypothetical protein
MVGRRGEFWLLTRCTKCSHGTGVRSIYAPRQGMLMLSGSHYHGPGKFALFSPLPLFLHVARVVSRLGLIPRVHRVELFSFRILCWGRTDRTCWNGRPADGLATIESNHSLRFFIHDGMMDARCFVLRSSFVRSFVVARHHGQTVRKGNSRSIVDHF